MFAQLRSEKTPARREQVFHRYLRLARSLAARYRYTQEPIEDLEQVASIGLLKAIDRFDPDRGNAFSSFAAPTILGEIRRHFRDTTWALRVPRKLQELTLRIEQAREELSASLGRPPTVAELSRRLDASEELILQALELSVVKCTLSLESPDEAPEDAGTPDCALGSVDDGYERAEERAVLGPLLATLSRPDAEIVLLRFRDDLTQDAIAHRVGVSQMQVSRVLYRSLVKLRNGVWADMPDGQSQAKQGRE